jgi:hypothetical protein
VESHLHGRDQVFEDGAGAERVREPDGSEITEAKLESELKVVRAEAIASGDADLHALGSYQGIPVLLPAACLKAHRHLKAQRLARLLAAPKLPFPEVPILYALADGYLSRPD